MKSTNDKLKTSEVSNAIRGSHAAQHAVHKLEGVYHAHLSRCRDPHLGEWNKVQQHLIQLNNKLRTLERSPSPDNMVERRLLTSEIDDIELYLQTLTEVEKKLEAPNVITDVGVRYLLDNGLAGSAFTAAYFMGLISSVSYTGVPVAADTMASHGTWTEAGAANAPTYSGARKTAAWAAATSRSKSLSAGLVFTFTGNGTVKGCFMTTVSTVDGTTGTLHSAGLFTGGDQPVVSTNTLTVTYTNTLT